ncbi:MAG: ubiquitin-like domain-containing protein [Oscillospiraceae bacterium]|nr:ubiquitin-like domain-containing protein [Oscillospiraceae bacterium]
MWHRPALVSAGVFSLGVSVILLTTGVLYFKSDVIITDGEEVKLAFTSRSDPNGILSDYGYAVGEFDRVMFSGISGGKGSIDIIRGFGVEVEADGEAFMAGAVEGESPEMILSAAGLRVGELDVVEIGEDGKIILLRGFGVNITADGKTLTVGAAGDTAGSLLKRAGISLGANDIINIAVDKEITRGDEIIIKRVAFRERTDTELIPYDTAARYSNLVAMGNVEVTQGVYGEIAVVYKEKLIDGVVVDSEVLSRETVKEPETEVVSYGNALRTPYSKRDFAEINLGGNGLPVDYLYVISGKSCAYTSNYGGTASGRKLQVGTVAVDPNVIPYGSLLYIVTKDGRSVYGAAVAADTGDFAESGVLVDLFMGTTWEHYDDACNWGAREVDVYVINQGVY